MVELKVEQYRLYESTAERRFIITADVSATDKWVKGTYAESWIDAKERLGFELTPEQKYLRNKQIEDADKRVAA